MTIIDLAAARRSASTPTPDSVQDGCTNLETGGSLRSPPTRRAPMEPPPARAPEPPPDARIREARAPRYTSYPTADRFVDAFGADEYARHLAARALRPAEPLSLYVHVPFCEALCHYCGCNRTVTRSRRKADVWLERLLDEAALVDTVLGGDRRVSQLHLGGGTPTFLDGPQLQRLMGGLRERFDLLAEAERSIEIDPRTVDAEKLALLVAEGFERMSFGVQDFDEDVQRAINRVQPAPLVRAALEAAREAGVRSVNFDLIYGLPRQSVARFERTVEEVLALRPERVALYHYAHLPSALPRTAADRGGGDPERRREARDLRCGGREARVGGLPLHRHGPLRAARGRARRRVPKR